MSIIERASKVKDHYFEISESVFGRSPLDMAIMQEVLFYLSEADVEDADIKYLEENFTLEQIEDAVEYWCEVRDESVYVDTETAAIIVSEIIKYHKDDRSHHRWERTDINREEYRHHIRTKFGLSNV